MSTPTLNRRSFSAKAAATMAASMAPAGSAPAAPRRNTLMHVGGDYHSVVGGSNADMTSRDNLEYNIRHGVNHLTIRAPQKAPDGSWDAADLRRMRDNCDKLGVTLEAIRMDPTYITQQTRPDRDRELDIIVRNIERASQVGVKIITYHWTVIPIRRNRKTPGRGGSTYAGFQLEKDWKDLPPTASGVVASDEYWERIKYFLDRAVPVARQYDLRLACHPYDPPGLPLGYQGAGNWDSPEIFAAIKRYESLVDSPYNGFQLCLGTVAEGLRKPDSEILPVVEYLGRKGKIYQIHMRNIRGQLHSFDEVFPDEGDLNLFRIMRVLRDIQFAYSICPDHMPRHAQDPDGLQAFAFGYGYIKALIHAVNFEA
jgi:mannonate dehydratase